jgi:hypothetical protein
MQDLSPRAAVNQFLRLCNEQRFDEATGYLDIPRQRAPFLRNVYVVKRLKLLLEQMGPLAIRPTSRDADGGTRIVTVIPTFTSETPIRLLCRLTEDGSENWVFSRGTLERIHQRLSDSEFEVAMRQDSPPPPRLSAFRCALLVLVSGVGVALPEFLQRSGESTQISVWGSSLAALSLALWRRPAAFKHRLMLRRWRIGHRASHTQATLGQRVARLAAFAVALTLFLSTLGHLAAEYLEAFAGVAGVDVFSWPVADPGTEEVGMVASSRLKGVA